MIAGCGSQLRTGGMGKPFALDFGAIMAVGAARQVDLGLLADVLPAAERAVIGALLEDDSSGEGEDG